MTRVYGPNNNALDSGLQQACSAATTEVDTPASSEVDVDSVGAGDGLSVTHNGAGSTNRAIYFETIGTEPNETSWPSGSVTVRINVSTGNTGYTWSATHLCRVNSGGTNQETWGSLTGQSTTLSAGEHSHVVSVSSLSASSSDRVYVVLTFTLSSGSHGNQNVVIDDSNSDITTPFPDPPTPSQQSRTASVIFRSSLEPNRRM